MQVNLFQLHESCTERRFENGKETSLEEELQRERVLGSGEEQEPIIYVHCTVKE